MGKVMAREFNKLVLVKSVAATSSEVETFTPAAKFNVAGFFGEAAFDPLCEVQLVWDHGGANELLWVIKGSGKIPFGLERTGNGVKKLAIVLNNRLANSVFMAGYCSVEHEVVEE